jgi:hypothetical protein
MMEVPAAVRLFGATEVASSAVVIAVVVVICTGPRAFERMDDIVRFRPTSAMLIGRDHSDETQFDDWE